ncbi:MAG TPA: hypothetical protein PKL73_17355, partial [Polyangiaceae bacterium]|nr:hypothetical protein [Polyangiaceae bacterium]
SAVLVSWSRFRCSGRARRLFEMGREIGWAWAKRLIGGSHETGMGLAWSSHQQEIAAMRSPTPP